LFIVRHRYTAKNHCDRYVTRLGNTDISFESLIISYAFSVTGSNSLKAKRNFGDILKRTKDISISPFKMSDSLLQ
jgi:hypothetical protein